MLDRETFLALWITLAFLLGLYLLGLIRLPHDRAKSHVSVTELLLATLSLSFAIYLVPGLWGAPLKAISAFAPPLYTQDFSLYKHDVRAHYRQYEPGMEAARQQQKPVILDFSGYGCVNCRKMENAVWQDPRIKSLMDEKYVLITLMVDDKTPLSQPYQVTENGKLRQIRTWGDHWSYLQRLIFGTNAQPFYVLLDHEGHPIGPGYAYNERVTDFIQYLENGLKTYRSRASSLH